MDEQNKQNQPDSQQDSNAGTCKIMCILAYIIPILFFLPLVVCPNSKFGRYHANQTLVFFLAAVVLNIIGGILSIIPAVGFIFPIIVNVAWLIWMILGIVNVANDAEKPLPVIGGFSLIK